MTESAANIETCPACGVGTKLRPTWDCGLCGFPPDYVEEVTLLGDPSQHLPHNDGGVS